MKSKNILTISIISIILIILIGAGIYIGLSEPTMQQTVGGSSTLGLQEVKYFKSSSTCFDSSSEKLWMYTLRGGGLGQWAKGEVSPSDVSDEYSGDEIPEKTLRIDSKYDQYCEYPLVKNPSANQIIKYSDPIGWTDINPFDGTCTENDAIEKCGTDAAWVGKYTIPTQCWCVSRIKKSGAIGSPPNFNYPNTRTDWEIEVEAGGQKYTESFSSNERIKGKIGNNVCAIWQGNTVTGSVCGLPQPDVRPGYINGKWELLSEDKYQNYLDYYRSFETDYSGSSGWWFSKTDLETAINRVNNEADRVLNSKVSFGTISEPTSLSNAKVVKKLSSLIQYPILTLYVKADWIGVVTPIPEPKIRSVSSVCFGSGRTGNIVVDIENIGTERGEIDIYANCEAGFDVSRKSISLLAGQRRNVYLEITGTTNQEELRGYCTVYADAIENIDDARVEVCVTGYAQCTEGEEWCESGNAWFCPDPMNPSLKEDCKSKGQICNYAEDGTTFCADSANWCDTHPDDPECGGLSCGCWIKLPFTDKCLLPDLWCHLNNWLVKFKWAFVIVVGFLGGLISTSYINLFFEKKSFKKKWWILLLTFLILGGAIGFLAFTYFWWIMLALIILGIIRAFIPGI